MSNLPSTQVYSSGSSSQDSGLSVGGYGGSSGGGRPSYSGSGSSNFGGFSAGRSDDYPSSKFMPSGQRDFEFKKPSAVRPSPPATAVQ